MTLFSVYSGKEQHHIYPNGDEVYFVNVVFVSKKYHGDLVIDGEETLELKYFNLDSFPASLSKTNIPIFSDLSRRLENL